MKFLEKLSIHIVNQDLVVEAVVVMQALLPQNVFLFQFVKIWYSLQHFVESMALNQLWEELLLEESGALEKIDSIHLLIYRLPQGLLEPLLKIVY